MSSSLPAASSSIDAAALRAECARRWGHAPGTELARATGYSRGFISLVFGGFRPSAEARRRICAALGPEAAARVPGLLEETPPPPSPTSGPGAKAS